MAYQNDRQRKAAFAKKSQRGADDILGIKRGITTADAKDIVQRSKTAKANAKARATEKNQSKPVKPQAERFTAIEEYQAVRGLPPEWSDQTQTTDSVERHGIRLAESQMTPEKRRRWRRSPGAFDILGRDSPEPTRLRVDHNSKRQKALRGAAQKRFDAEHEKRRVESEGDKFPSAPVADRLLGLETERHGGKRYVRERVKDQSYAGAPTAVLHGEDGERLFAVPNADLAKSKQRRIVKRLNQTHPEKFAIEHDDGSLRYLP